LYTCIKLISDIFDVVTDGYGKQGETVWTQGGREICPTYGKLLLNTQFSVDINSDTVIKRSKMFGTSTWYLI